MVPFTFLVFLGFMCDVHARRMNSQGTARQGRLHTTGRKVPTGPHKCTIRWPGREGTPEKVASFGVKQCKIQCIQTNADYHHDLIFSRGIKTAQLGGNCSCQTLAGRELFKLPGSCGDDEQFAAKRCFLKYKELVTDEYKEEAGSEARTVRHHHELTNDKTFDYGECEKEGCADEGCPEITLPSLWENRNEHERKLLSKIIANQTNGGNLNRDEKEIIEQLGDEDLKIARELVLEEISGNEREDMVEKLAELSEGKGKGKELSIETSLARNDIIPGSTTTTTALESSTTTTSTSSATTTSALESSTTTTSTSSATTTSFDERDLMDDDSSAADEKKLVAVPEPLPEAVKDADVQNEDCKARIAAIVQFGEAHEAVFEKCFILRNEVMDGDDTMALSEEGKMLLCSKECAVDKTITPPDLEAIRGDCQDAESRSALGDLLTSFNMAKFLHDELVACPESTTTTETTTTSTTTINTTSASTTESTEPTEAVDCEKEIEGLDEHLAELREAFVDCSMQHSDVLTDAEGVTTVSDEGQTKLCAQDCQESAALLSGFPDMESTQKVCTDDDSVEELSSDARLAKYSMLKAIYQEWNTCAVFADIHKVVMDPNCDDAKQVFSRWDFHQKGQLKYDEVFAIFKRYRYYQDGMNAVKDTVDRIYGALDARSEDKDPIQEDDLVSIMLGDEASGSHFMC